MAGPLPKYVAFTSASNSTKFFRPVGSANLLKFEEVDFFSWGVKHEIAYSRSEPGNVHIKCVDTGKYWTWGLDSTTEDYIAAQATFPLSDRSDNQSTLVNYSRHTIGGDSVFRLRFRWNSEWHTICKDGGGFLRSGITKGSEVLYHNFIIVDWEQQVVRARQIAKDTSGGGAASSGVTEVVEYQMVRRVVYEID